MTYYSSTHVAAVARTTLKAVRLWEGRGLFGQVKRNDRGDRAFTEGQVRLARMISVLQVGGLSINEIKEALAKPFPGNVVVTKICELREFLDEAENILMGDKGFDL